MSRNLCKESVFKRVFYDYSEQLRNFIYYQSGSLGLSEDLVQEAFIQLWQNCAKIDFEKSKSYLFTVARNRLINHAKRDKVKLKHRESIQKREDHQSPEYLMEEREFKDRLSRAISELPEDQRIVFLMHRLDKKKYKEIAEELGLSVKAIEKRMHKALQSLRKVYEKI